jgi:hypothetical protein
MQIRPWFLVDNIEIKRKLVENTLLDKIRFKDLKDKYLYARQNILH